MNAQPDQATLRDLLDQDRGRIRKLQIIFGQWWQHYAVPYELRWMLWAERSLCPYCSGPLGAPPIDANQDDTDSPAHLDHMDPLSRGGEESIRNVVYACARCNLAKGKRLFVDWLAQLPQPNQALARQIYTEKHGHPPEAFTPGPALPRLTLARTELEFDESVLRRLFPKPLVQVPPRRIASAK